MKNFNSLLFILTTIAGLAFAAPAAKPTPAGPAQPKTSITSETLEMVSGPVNNTFYFSKNVVVTGNNLKMTAEQMVVTARRAGESAAPLQNPAASLDAPGGSTIDKIVAVGNVHIYQEARESISGRAEFYPKEGKVVLTDKPRVIDAKAIVSGWRITLYQGERKVMVEQDPAQGGTRPSVNLDSIPDMGFDPKTEPPPMPPAPAVPAGAPAPGSVPAAQAPVALPQATTPLHAITQPAHTITLTPTPSTAQTLPPASTQP